MRRRAGRVGVVTMYGEAQEQLLGLVVAQDDVRLQRPALPRPRPPRLLGWSARCGAHAHGPSMAGRSAPPRLPSVFRRLSWGSQGFRGLTRAPEDFRELPDASPEASKDLEEIPRAPEGFQHFQVLPKASKASMGFRGRPWAPERFQKAPTTAGNLDMATVLEVGMDVFTRWITPEGHQVEIHAGGAELLTTSQFYPSVRLLPCNVEATPAGTRQKDGGRPSSWAQLPMGLVKMVKTTWVEWIRVMAGGGGWEGGAQGGRREGRGRGRGEPVLARPCGPPPAQTWGSPGGKPLLGRPRVSRAPPSHPTHNHNQCPNHSLPPGNHNHIHPQPLRKVLKRGPVKGSNGGRVAGLLGSPIHAPVGNCRRRPMSGREGRGRLVNS